MQYARLNDDNSLRDIIEMSDEQYAALEGHPKRASLRPMVSDPQPTPSATQAVSSGPIVVEPGRARWTWALRDKTAAELNAERNAGERPSIRAMLAALDASIEAPDTLGTAVDRLMKLEQRMLRLERIARHFVRGLLP